MTPAPPRVKKGRKGGMGSAFVRSVAYVPYHCATHHWDGYLTALTRGSSLRRRTMKTGGICPVGANVVVSRLQANDVQS